jgi:hypothetical protein
MRIRHTLTSRRRADGWHRRWQDSAYERARDSKLFAGLMSLDEIKAKKARIESGEEFEGAAAKAARARRADQEAAVRERLVTPRSACHLFVRNPHREP